MKNPNALIAMALVSQNADNPYSTFCEYIKYCIFVNVADTLTIADIRRAVSDEFGLNIPYNVAIECINRLRNEGIIIDDGHQFKRIGSFDIERFERSRSEYRNIEDTIINALVQYVLGYGRTWSTEYAREQLIKILDRNGLAYDIFFHKKATLSSDAHTVSDVEESEELLPDDKESGADIENTDNQPLFSDELFAGKFVEKVLSEDTIQKDYLLKICEGLMLCIGTYQLPSSNASAASLQIDGSDFFFDTRLLLRFVGCAGDAAVEAAGELVKLIQSSGGRIRYYPQTLEEMYRAFDEAVNSLSHGYPPHDEEMRLYSVRIKNSIAVISAKKANLKDELSKANIYFLGNMKILPILTEFVLGLIIMIYTNT